MQVLLVEDDQALATALLEALQKQGYTANAVGTGEAAIYVISTDPPDIVILDLGLPDIDGINLLKRVRKKHAGMPVLILTARTGLDDKIIGLDSGADDYLPKPFEMSELLARLRVLGRRLSTSDSTEISVGNVTLDVNSNLVSVSGNPLELSRREFMLLKTLLENAGRILTRSMLENHLYNWDEEVSSNALEVHIHHLRKKLGTDFIHTVRGVGYQVKKS